MNINHVGKFIHPVTRGLGVFRVGDGSNSSP